MYILTMAVVLRKKPVTIYLQEIKYLMFQKMAKDQNRKAAELVRDAMDEYIQTHSAGKKTFDSSSGVKYTSTSGKMPPSSALVLSR